MNLLDHALALAAKGFWIFPLRHDQKIPAHKGWADEATRDEDIIRKWFNPNRSRSFNIGISTSKFMDDLSLCVVDIDTKKGKRGYESLLELELQGLEFPDTLEHETASGSGRHLVYVCDEPLHGGTDVLGFGLDVKSLGGLVVGPGSEVGGATYKVIADRPLAPIPAWLRVRLGAGRVRSCAPGDVLPGVDLDRARARATAYLTSAPGAVEGEGGDTTTYRVAARVKDFGVPHDEAALLMDEHWNDRCAPPWSLEELFKVVDHAYQYGKEIQGSAAPEAAFPQDETEEDDTNVHPIHALNKEYAFVKQGAFVLQETNDEDGNPVIERLAIAEFHAWHENRLFAIGDQKPKPISRHWMSWTGRREYDGVTFSPEKDLGPRWYNLWRGFTVKPSAKAKHEALDLFLEHALQNVCNGDRKLFTYLMTYFAHMVQRPWEKPLVALVFKGKKGVGKNALVERVGALLGSHFLVADDDRYLLGNFNSHLESNLCFVLDEAAWAGDKRSEGKLKGLITGQKHLIEHKNKEPRNKKNLSRIVILGNEDWLVPASQDERRFAVFNVGDGRMQDRQFFIAMRVGMEQGGYAHLLRYLMDWDLAQADINDAPQTQGLVDQKVASLNPLAQWWHECLATGQIAGGDWAGEWPESLPTVRVRESYYRWARGRNVRSRLEDEIGFGRAVKKMSPSFRKKRGTNAYAYHTPGLDRLRNEFERFLGGALEWD